MIAKERKNQTPKIVKNLIKSGIHNRQNLEGHYHPAPLLDYPLDCYKRHQ
jgi:hypothetical protein